MSARMTELLDARGVVIESGDTVIYGFSVSRSVAMAEGVVVGEEGPCVGPNYWGCEPGSHSPRCPASASSPSVSLTSSGRVRVRVVRRSYGSGEKPVVDVMPDRLVVLKPTGNYGHVIILPPSPLPTQGEEVRAQIEKRIESYTDDLRSDTITWGESCFADLADFHAYAAKGLAEQRRKLKALDDG